MRELPQPGEEPLPEHMRYLVTETDEAGKEAEDKTADLERLAARFSAETGETFNVQYFEMTEPEGAVAREVAPWPDGSRCIISTHWTGSRGPTWRLDPRPSLDGEGGPE